MGECGVNEKQLNDAGFFVEAYGNGFMVADYSDGDNVRYCGSDLDWRRQPITYHPFPDTESAINAVAPLVVESVHD
jgi:hypothetical protein